MNSVSKLTVVVIVMILLFIMIPKGSITSPSLRLTSSGDDAAGDFAGDYDGGGDTDDEDNIVESLQLEMNRDNHDGDSNHGGKMVVQERIEDLLMDEQQQRKLNTQNVPCASGGPIRFFSLDFQLTPQGGWDLSGCNYYYKRRLGNAINSFLLDYGIGDAGAGDQIAFLAEVCNVPSIDNATLTGGDHGIRSRARNLAFKWNFRYTGGGNCRFCRKDNFDARRRTSKSGLDDERSLQTFNNSAWFQNIFKPEIQNTLRNAFTTDVAPMHKTCLGNGPRVDVTLTQIASAPDTSC